GAKGSPWDKGNKKKAEAEVKPEAQQEQQQAVVVNDASLGLPKPKDTVDMYETGRIYGDVEIDQPKNITMFAALSNKRHTAVWTCGRQLRCYNTTNTDNNGNNGNNDNNDNNGTATTFAELGIDARLIQSASTHYNIHTPTPMQTSIIQSILQPSTSGTSNLHHTLLRHETGSGKTFGMLLATLTLALQAQTQPYANETSQRQHQQQRTLFLVPNRELALQIEHWAHTLLSPFPTLSHKKLIQSFVSGTPYEQDQIGILRRHGIPRITLGTPRRLLELLSQPSRGEHTGLLFGGLARVVVDEIDAVLKLPGKHASEKQIKLRREKPRPGQMLVERIVGVAPNEQKDA
ncbi:hypothetical protein GGF37_006907, partial [Kickxella alabastrina]